VRNAAGEPESAVAVEGLLELRSRGFSAQDGGSGTAVIATETFIEELREEKIASRAEGLARQTRDETQIVDTPPARRCANASKRFSAG
jgi:hypothetical protein